MQDSSKCNKPCDGDFREMCGGSNALNLYQNGQQKYTRGPVAVLAQNVSDYWFTACWK